jgi:hypothetical protein
MSYEEFLDYIVEHATRAGLIAPEGDEAQDAPVNGGLMRVPRCT